MDTLDPTLATALGQNPNPENKSQGQQQQQNVVNDKKNVDIDKKNTYTNGESANSGDGQSAGESADEKFHRILNDTFGGDATKAVKSWVEAQSKYADTSREFKRVKTEYDNFNNLLQTNPALFDIVKRASQGEKIENLLGQTAEPNGKPVTSTSASQLDGSTSVDEKKLIEAGYLDRNKLESMDDFNRQMAILNATQRYMFEKVPEEISKRTQEKLAQQHQAEQERIKRESTQQTNIRRWQEGVKTAATQGWDFTGEHEALLDELEAEVNGIRDTKDLNLIGEDAVEIALSRIARRNGIQVKKTTPTQQMNLPQGQKNYNQTNMQSRNQSGEVQPEDFHHKLILDQQKANRNKPQDYLQAYKNRGK
jgi:hypothetical protein